MSTTQQAATPPPAPMVATMLPLGPAGPSVAIGPQIAQAAQQNAQSPIGDQPPRMFTDEEILGSLLDKYTSGSSPGPYEDSGDFEEVVVEATPPSDTALVVDKWGMRKGKELARHMHNEALREFKEAKNQYGSDSEEYKTAEYNASDESPIFDPLTMADIHAACFDMDPVLAERPKDQMRSHWMQQLMESPDFRAMHAQINLDVCLAEIAAASISKQYAQYVRVERQKQAQQQGGGNGDGPGGTPGSGNSNGGGGGAGSGTGAGNGQYIRQMLSTGKAVSHAKKEVAYAQDVMNSLGSDMLKDDAAAIFKRVRRNKQLLPIIEMAGRYRRLAMTKQRQKSLHGVDDVAGIVLGGDIERIIPSELALLDIPELELDTLRRIAERECHEFQFTGTERKTKGPIILCIDESGSMSGERIANAKAIAMAMAWVARQQKRWCAMVSFSGTSEGHWVALPPDRWDSEKLLEWVSKFDGGGTIPDVPLKTVREKYWVEMGAPKGKTDLITITDGGMHVPEDMLKDFLEWKQKEQVKHYGIIIDDDPQQFGESCDQIWKIKSLSIEESCVSELVSI